MKRVLGLALPMLLALLLACGADRSASTIDPASGSATRNARNGGSSARSGAPTEGVKPSASFPQSATVRGTSSGSPMTLVIALSAGCTVAGQGRQTLTVRGLSAGEAVGYSTQYADGSNELTNKSYAAGYASGKGDAKGSYVSTWVLPGTAPAGRATVLFIHSAGNDPQRVSFDVRRAGGTC